MLMRFAPFREVERWASQLSAGTRGGMVPVDAYRHGDHWVAAFDFPASTQVVIAERPQGTFTRGLALGDGVDAEHVKASYDAGVLTVRLPVAEHAKPRKVSIMTGSGQHAIEAGAQAA